MSPHSCWLLVHEIVPRLRVSIASTVHLSGSDDIEELVQDGTAMAASFLQSAESRGKQVSAGNIAYYAVKHLKSGRRSTGVRKTDVMHPAAQMAGRSQVVSIDEPAHSHDNDDAETIGDSLASGDDPSVEASRRLDWKQLERTLDRNTRAVLLAMVAGDTLTDLEPVLHKSRSGIQNDKERLAQMIKESLGDDILKDVQERSTWRTSLDSRHERVACRAARRY